jgi:diguanylate cyclase (GGDEF)-like protein
MIDIDHFKAYNDVYGHMAGDRCLVQVGRVLNKVVKEGTGVVARFGGEEFAALLPAAMMADAIDVAKTIIDSVAGLQLDHEGTPAGKTSVSIGVSVLDLMSPATLGGPDELLNLADRALYEAKRAGRGRFSVWGSFSTD